MKVRLLRNICTRPSASDSPTLLLDHTAAESALEAPNQGLDPTPLLRSRHEPLVSAFFWSGEVEITSSLRIPRRRPSQAPTDRAFVTCPWLWQVTADHRHLPLEITTNSDKAAYLDSPRRTYRMPRTTLMTICTCLLDQRPHTTLQGRAKGCLTNLGLRTLMCVKTSKAYGGDT